MLLLYCVSLSGLEKKNAICTRLEEVWSPSDAYHVFYCFIVFYPQGLEKNMVLVQALFRGVLSLSDAYHMIDGFIVFHPQDFEKNMLLAQ